MKPTVRVFIDTSVLIAGLASEAGASGAVLDLCEAGLVQMVVSRQVLVEADRNFSAKLPDLVDSFRRFIRDLRPLMVEDPPVELVERTAKVVNLKDAPILAAAQSSESDYLITLDKKHFLKVRDQVELPLSVVTPEEFLRAAGF
jgi:putative PIN family toxin of toxin-antitoxin system